MIWSPPAHPARVAYARHAAGDEANGEGERIAT